MSFNPSEEQKNILNFLKEGHNVVSDCVAGSGKTTTTLLVAKLFPEKRIGIVTYNSALKVETRKRAQELGIENLEVHSFNSLAVKYYNREAHKNEELIKIIQTDNKPLITVKQYDILIIDETQDMSELFFKLIKKFVRDGANPKQMLILGDKNQTIYKFAGADSRYLTMCSLLWERTFVPCTLHTSYRVTNQIANFVNSIMLGHNRIVACKDGPRVEYRICDVFRVAENLGREIVSLIRSGKYLPSDFFVLAYSLKSSNSESQPPVRALENILAQHNIKCFYQTNDDIKVDDDLMKDKLVFSTFHKSKGRERKFVIIFGFDESYYKYYAREEQRTDCTELMYVATTRASERLLLLHNWKEKPLPFLKKSISDLERDPNVIFNMERHYKFFDGLDPFDRTRRPTTVTALIERLKTRHQYMLDNLCNIVFQREKEAYKDTKIISTIEDETTEDVSQINGIAIPAMYEMELHGECTIQNVVDEKYTNYMEHAQFPWMRQKYKSICDGAKSIQGYLKLTLFYICFVEQLYHMINQITKFNWLTRHVVDECFEVLRKHVDNSCKFEAPVYAESTLCPEYGTIEIRGRLDIWNPEQVLEIKCVNTIALEHKLQLIMYAYICSLQSKDSAFPHVKYFRLLNIRTGECFLLDKNSHLITEVVQILFHNKYEQNERLTDEVFIAENKKKLISEVAVIQSSFDTSDTIEMPDAPLFIND